MIEIKNLTFAYKNKNILENLQLNINKGSLSCLIGENGVGKSTLIKLICNLEKVKSGEVLIDNLSYKLDNDLIRNKLFATVNEPSFYSHLTVYENLNLFCKYKKINNDRINEILITLNIEPDKKIKHLSSGMKQKLSLAFPMLFNYEYLILDEPLANVDPIGIELILDIFKKMNDEKGTTILISTHLIGEFADYFHEYILMKNGNILYQGPKDGSVSEFKSKLLNLYKN